MPNAQAQVNGRIVDHHRSTNAAANPEHVLLAIGHVRGSGVRSGLRVILGWTLCGDGGDGHLRVCRVRVDDLGGAAFGEDVQADVAAHLGPFVVLLGEHGSDQAD
jgi:hypothetical protein